MPNSSFDISQYEYNTAQADIQSLKQFFDERDSWENPSKYTVLEYFSPENSVNYSPTVYNVTNLVITDIEDGIVICDGYLDKEDIMLFNNMIDNGEFYNLNTFLVDDIIMIGMDEEQITISFNYGYIRIYY